MNNLNTIVETKPKGRAPKGAIELAAEARRKAGPGRAATQFKKGRPKTGGRQRHADVWDLLTRAAEIAWERERKDLPEGSTPPNAAEFAAQLVDQVKRIDPVTALKVMAKHILPPASAQGPGIEIDHDNLIGTLEKITDAMAKQGANLDGLERLRVAVSDLIEQKAKVVAAKVLEEELRA
ncbi:hypothetical protein [Aeromonas dhakensis]|uniref:hypothetical protein n=1 Tax=Aeromonas dhakensis TaxID=196024 RepID=UPI0005A98247|nr:hypothetical protein [Aeromonas dhakensis]